MLEKRSEIIDGKKKIIITREASGVDKTKEAVLRVMGPGWRYKDDEDKAEENYNKEIDVIDKKDY